MLCVALFVPSAATLAQAPEPPADEIAKIEAADQREQDEKDGKTNAPIIVELFTGSECSACIFADRMLYDALQDERVIALSCRVQAPTAASFEGVEENPDNLNEGPMDPCVFRQWTYKSTSHNTDISLKIPMFYFNGEVSVRGEDMSLFKNTLKKYHYKGANGGLEAMMRWKDRDTITIHLPEATRRAGTTINASVWVVRYKDMDVMHIDKGINKGRVLRFSNIIQNVTHIAKWHGDMRMIDVDVPPPQGGKERGGYAVLVAEMLGTPYLAAGKLKDYAVAADLKEEAEKREQAKEAAEGKLKALPSDKAPVKAGPALP